MQSHGVVLDVAQQERKHLPVTSAAAPDATEHRLLEEVDRARRNLYAEEENAKGTRSSFYRDGTYRLVTRDHVYLDAVSARVVQAREQLRAAERDLAVYRETRGKR